MINFLDNYYEFVNELGFFLFVILSRIFDILKKELDSYESDFCV